MTPNPTSSPRVAREPAVCGEKSSPPQGGTAPRLPQGSHGAGCCRTWSEWLGVPAVCCWKSPGRLRVGEWQSSNICRDSTRQAQCDSCVIVQQTDAEQSTAGPGRSDQGEVESAHEIRHSRRTEHETQHVQQLHEILPACLHRKTHNQPERNTLAIDLLWKNGTADAWWRL